MSGKTPFAGYEYLLPGESLSADGYFFQYQNPKRADRLGQLGAVTHKHDAHAALADPTSALVLATAAVGGSIPSGQPIYVTYTLHDGAGGETLPVAAGIITTAAGYLDPTSAPTGAVDYSAGALLASNPSYAVTITDGAGGETALSPAITLTIDPGHPTARVNLSGLAALVAASSGGAAGAGWRMWRSNGGGPWYLMGTGTADTFVDSGTTPGDCTVAPPASSTTLGTNTFTATVPAAGQPAGAVTFSLYGSTDGALLSPALLGTYPVADFGAAKAFTALTVTDGAPPPLSSCYPGANKIDPATDILNFPWKRPVATASALPGAGNSDGDVRGALDTHRLYQWNSGSAAWAVYPPPPAAAGSPSWKGPVANVAALPGGGNTAGDVRITLDTFVLYSWNGTAWVAQPDVEAPPVFTRTTTATALAGLTTATETAKTLNAPGKGSLLYAVTVDAACRVRLYPTAALATADIARLDSTDPDAAAAASCLLDHVFTAAGTFAIPRGHLAVNMEAVPAATLAANVRVDGGLTAVNVSLLGYPVE